MAGYDVPAFYDGESDYDVGLAVALSDAIASGLPGRRRRTYSDFVEKFKKHKRDDWHKIEEDRREKLHKLLHELLGPNVDVAGIEDVAEVAELIDKMETPPRFDLELLILSQYI